MIDQKQARIIASSMATILEPSRIRIFHYLAAGPANVTVVAEGLGLSTVTASHHLVLLQRAGFLLVQRDGHRKIYQLDSAVCRVTAAAIEISRDGVTIAFAR